MGLFSRTPKQPSAVPATESAAPTEQTASPASADTGRPLVANTLVQAALVKWGEKKSAQTMNEVLRQCATGELLVDIGGSDFADISKGLQPGDKLGIGQVVDNAGQRLLLVFTSNEALRAYRPDVAPMSLAQPASGVMKQALSDFEGVAIDPADPNTCIIYNREIQLGLSEEPAINEALKTGLVENRSADEIRELAASTPLLFIGVTEVRNDAGEIVGATLPSVQTTAGERCALAFTSPAEVWAFDATLSARPTGFDNVIDAARSNGHAAVMLNPMGPWAILRVQDVDAA
jgi:hypothetical protein